MYNNLKNKSEPDHFLKQRNHYSSRYEIEYWVAGIKQKVEEGKILFQAISYDSAVSFIENYQGEEYILKIDKVWVEKTSQHSGV